MKRLHTSVKPFHRSLETRRKPTNFAHATRLQTAVSILYSIKRYDKGRNRKEKIIGADAVYGRTRAERDRRQGRRLPRDRIQVVQHRGLERGARRQECNPSRTGQQTAAHHRHAQDLQVNDSKDPALVAGLGDKLAKLSAVIEKLDKKANVVDVIEVFMAFSKWIEFRSTVDPEVTPELIKAINKYQDLYITQQMGIK